MWLLTSKPETLQPRSPAIDKPIGTTTVTDFFSVQTGELVESATIVVPIGFSIAGERGCCNVVVVFEWLPSATLAHHHSNIKPNKNLVCAGLSQRSFTGERYRVRHSPGRFTHGDSNGSLKNILPLGSPITLWFTQGY